jgi:hypothetical protein
MVSGNFTTATSDSLQALDSILGKLHDTFFWFHMFISSYRLLMCFDHVILTGRLYAQPEGCMSSKFCAVAYDEEGDMLHIN